MDVFVNGAHAYLIIQEQFYTGILVIELCYFTRTGKKLEWDSASVKAKNAPEADKFIKEQYRAGWEIEG